LVAVAMKVLIKGDDERRAELTATSEPCVSSVRQIDRGGNALLPSEAQNLR
jgi:hypothetical protein